MSQQINLFNPILLKQKKQFSAATMAQALAVIAVVLVGFSVYSNYRRIALKADADQAAAKVTQEEANLVAVVEKSKPKEPDPALQEEVRRAEEKLKGYRAVLDYMKKGDFGNSEGYSEYLRAFARHTKQDLWLTDFSIQGAATSIRIGGRALGAPAVPAYIDSLRQEAVFRGKSFSALEIRTEAPKTARENNAAAPLTLAGQIEFVLNSAPISANPEPTGATRQ